MKNPAEFRQELQAYAQERKRQAVLWKRLAEDASRRARICEDAAYDAQNLTKINDDSLQELDEELVKIQDRYRRKIEMAGPLVVEAVDEHADVIQRLRDWMNNHTNYSGPAGPTSPPLVCNEETTCRAR
jgi:hypothetical protein